MTAVVKQAAFMAHKATMSGMLPKLIAYATLYLVWGSTYFAIKETVHTLHPALVVGIRFTLGGIMLLALGAALGRWRRAPSAAEWRTTLLLSVLLLLLGNGMVTWAEVEVDSYLAALIIASTPLAVAVFNRILFKMPVSLSGLAGILLGLLGVALVLYDGSSLFTSMNHSTWLILAAVISWALGTSLGKSLPTYPDVVVAGGLQSVFGGLWGLLVYAFVFRGPWPDFAVVSTASWLSLLYLIVPGSLAFVAFGYLVQHEPSSRVVSYALVNPAIAVLIGLGMGEKAMPFLWAGLPLILAGVFLMLYGESLRARWK
jgi:drug/metabolite transporter (DMT)-like permease